MKETIGGRILLLIENKNLKKVEFAKTLNINQSYVTQLIKGRNHPSDRLVEDICQKFNVSKSWLCDGTGDMYTPTTNIINDASLDAADREILQSYIRMTPAQRQFIKSWISNVASAISKVGTQETDREKAHRLLDQELDAEAEDASVSTAGSSDTEKNA